MDREALRAAGRKVVFTNGCFDILHAGHVKLLETSRKFGDFLVVGINSDASVRRLKGPRRPRTPEGDRAAILASIRWVDEVVVFDEDTPYNLIMRIRPDVLVKGADYGEGQIVGEPEVLDWGGSVHRVQLLPGRSTSALLAGAGTAAGLPESESAKGENL